MSLLDAGPADPSPGPTRPPDAFADLADGAYRDQQVTVRRLARPRPSRRAHQVRTEHFDVSVSAGRVEVGHSLELAGVDEGLGGLLADELFGPGWLRGPELFERVFTGVVRSLCPDAERAWAAFYENTLAAGARPGDTLAPVHRHVLDLVTSTGAPAGADDAPPSVLELGCCFGFTALDLARRGHPTTATDLSAGSVALLGRMAARMGVPLRTLVADAARTALPDRSHDVVLAVHLLEHLDHDTGDRVVAEGLRLARRRLVVAVPFEDEPEPLWGHVRTVTPADLHRWGRMVGAAYEVHEHHGGWLVVDL